MLCRSLVWRATLSSVYALCIGVAMLRAQEAGSGNRTNSLPEGDGKALVLLTCTQCHSLGTIVLQRKSASQWGKTISDMVSRGAQISPDEIASISTYLARSFGADTMPAPAASETVTARPGASAAFNERTAADLLPEGSGKAIILRSCVDCHGLEKITAQGKKDEAGWLASVKDMIRLGAKVRQEEAPLISAYLAKNFGPKSPASGSTTPTGSSVENVMTPSRSTDLSRLLPDGEGKGLILATCVQCHGLQEITGQRKEAQDWKRTVHDMVSRGAQVSSSEADLIVAYLAERLGKKNK